MLCERGGGGVEIQVSVYFNLHGVNQTIKNFVNFVDFPFTLYFKYI
jgi:hypothetical protein